MPDLVMRQLAMLSLIPKGAPGISTAAIAEALKAQDFEISRRSIQRDLEKLSAVYPLTCDSEGRTNLWYYLTDSAHVLIPSMDVNTALTLKLAQQHLQPLIPQRVRAFLEPYFPQADKVLLNHPSRLKNWTEKTRAISLGLQQTAPQITGEVWDVITQAIVDKEMCEVSYHSHQSDQPKTYRISPLAVVIRGPVTYLLAVYEGYQDIRQMALHRFHNAKALLNDAFIPEDFCLDDYIQSGNFGILYDKVPQLLEMTVSSSVARILREVPLSDEQDIFEAQSEIWVRCRLPESWDLYRWLLAHAMDIKVHSPANIRDTLIEYLRISLEQYQDKSW